VSRSTGPITKILQVSSPASCPAVKMADGQVEVVDSILLSGDLESSGDGREMVQQQIACDLCCTSVP